MTRRSIPVYWVLLHAGPLLLVPAATHSLHNAIGIDTAAAITHLLVLGSIAVGQTYLLRSVLPRSRAWAWRTSCGLACAVVAGLVVMSTIDLAGYDTLATVMGMLAAGLTLGVLQAPAQPLPKRRWVAASLVGWGVGAIVFRSVIQPLAEMWIGGFTPFALAYNSGHNELLWSAVGLACYGIATAWNIAAIARVTTDVHI